MRHASTASEMVNGYNVKANFITTPIDGTIKV